MQLSTVPRLPELDGPVADAVANLLAERNMLRDCPKGFPEAIGQPLLGGCQASLLVHAKAQACHVASVRLPGEVIQDGSGLVRFHQAGVHLQPSPPQGKRML